MLERNRVTDSDDYSGSEGQKRDHIFEGFDFCSYVVWPIGKESVRVGTHSSWELLRNVLAEDAEGEWEKVERAIEVNDLYHKLSKEAKEVIGLVINTPGELIQFLIDNPRLRLSMQVLKDYLRFYGWKHIVIGKAFAEIQRFVKNF